MNELLFDPETHRKAGHLLGELLANYEIDLSNRPVFPQINRDAMRAILTEPLPEVGKSLEELFQEFRDVVVPNSTHVAHPRFLPYVLPSPNGISAFADALASTLNQNCNLWTLSPAANAIEQRVISWFHELFSFPKGSGGIITSGGSMANLTALAVARDTYLGNPARTEGVQGRTSPLILYVSEQVHNSVDKAAVILGLGLNHVRHIPCDTQFRIRMDLLKQAVLRDRREGFSPFCVVGSAGTVMTGAIDPLDALADFVERSACGFTLMGPMAPWRFSAKECRHSCCQQVERIRCHSTRTNSSSLLWRLDVCLYEILKTCGQRTASFQAIFRWCLIPTF